MFSEATAAKRDATRRLDVLASYITLSSVTYYAAVIALLHSLATSTLRAGATMGEIGEVLRHRDLSTTEIYAKVDSTTASAQYAGCPVPG